MCSGVSGPPRGQLHRESSASPSLCNLSLNAPVARDHLSDAMCYHHFPRIISVNYVNQSPRRFWRLALYNINAVVTNPLMAISVPSFSIAKKSGKIVSTVVWLPKATIWRRYGDIIIITVYKFIKKSVHWFIYIPRTNSGGNRSLTISQNNVFTTINRSLLHSNGMP